MTDHYTAERTLRKKYYNMVEDMKGIVFDTQTHKCQTIKGETFRSVFV